MEVPMTLFIDALTLVSIGLCVHALNVAHTTTRARRVYANFVFVGAAAFVAFVAGAVIG